MAAAKKRGHESGFANRKIGATSINSKSSRSHIMFTCIIESWCKETSSKCFGSSKTSRISLADLAGFEGNTPEDASRHHMKERKYIKKTISQLGILSSKLLPKSHCKLTVRHQRKSLSERVCVD